MAATSHIFAKLLQAVERGAFPRGRKLMWRALYSLLSLTWRDDNWRFMNYGFLPPGAPFPLDADDEADRAFIGLYQQAIDGLPAVGARILEVGCGRGGGARYIARYHQPASVIGLDYSPATVRRARRLNRDAPTLSFKAGDAERLPFPDGSMDIIVNIESSHCYANLPAFARETGRVLAPGGWFTFADMRTRSMLPDLDRQLAASGLELAAESDLSAGVVAALDEADARKREVIGRYRGGRRFLQEFAGLKGSILYNELSKGRLVYVARRYRKAD